MAQQTCKILHVSGNVQGVGFRYFTYQYAQKTHLTGTVRNLSDGRVEIIVCGAATHVEKLITWLQNGGPRSAKISHLAITDAPDKQFETFSIIH